MSRSVPKNDPLAESDCRSVVRDWEASSLVAVGLSSSAQPDIKFAGFRRLRREHPAHCHNGRQAEKNPLQCHRLPQEREVQNHHPSPRRGTLHTIAPNSCKTATRIVTGIETGFANLIPGQTPLNGKWRGAEPSAPSRFRFAERVVSDSARLQ